MSKLDDLAKAIYEARTASRRALNSTTWVSGYDELPDDAKHYERLGARAALEVLRQPNAAMRNALGQWLLDDVSADEVFPELIDAILSEGTET